MQKLLGILSLAALIGLMGYLDCEEEQMQAALYCANVADGEWPDFKGNYHSECRADVLVAAVTE